MRELEVNLENEFRFLYTKSLIEDFPDFPARNVAPCSVLLGNEEIGGLFMTLPKEDLKYFGLTSNATPEPMFKFRMLNIAKTYYIIEIWLIFDENESKILKIHLNPESSLVTQFLNIVRQNNLISVHFNGKDSEIIGSVFTSLHLEHFNWIKRNCILSGKLTRDQGMFSTFSSQLAKDMKPSDRLYTPQDTDKQSYFVGEGEELESYSK